MQDLHGKVALVTGASRGAGRGIAVTLGEKGATVYVTGRSVRGQQTRPDLPHTTIEDTATHVTTQGGLGIPVRCDHTVDEQVAALFQHIRRDQGRLDILVNNAWAGYEEYGSDKAFDVVFWEQPLWRWDKMFTGGVRAHFTASRLAVPLMLPQGHGLIVNTTFWDRGKCLSNLPYDLAKTTINRMAYVMGLELRPFNIAALALAPGWMRTESILRTYDIDEARWQEIAELGRTESTYYIGRAVAALATDPKVIEKTGQTLTVGALAREYGFTDINGRQPPTYQMAPEHLRD
jgi:NAD(P)-dependent dehydrogenase (short-subunit alcohol dehydrogenase family)